MNYPVPPYWNTGKKAPQLSVSRDSTYLTNNDGLLISAPASNEYIVIIDVLVESSSGKLGAAADGGGTLICYVNQGNNSFGIPVSVPSGQAVYTDVQGGNITVTYATLKGSGPPPPAPATTTTTGGPTTTAAPTSISFVSGTSSIVEPSRYATVHYVTVQRDTSIGAVTVKYETSDGTATAGQYPAGEDYVSASGEITFCENETSKTIEIEIGAYPLQIAEGNETFNITLSAPTQTVGIASITGTNPHVVTITDAVVATTTTGAPTTTSAPLYRWTGTNCVGGGPQLYFSTTQNMSWDVNKIYQLNCTNPHTCAAHGHCVNGSTIAWSAADEIEHTYTHPSVFDTCVECTGTTTTAAPTTTTTAAPTTTTTAAPTTTTAAPTTTTAAPTTTTTAAPTTTTTAAPTTTTTAAPTTTTAAPTTTTAAPTTTTAAPTTTTSTPGSYFQVEDCTSSSVYYIIEDSMSYMPALGDVVHWMDSNYITSYCGTVTATSVGGTSVGDIQGVEDMNMDPYTCATCNSENIMP